MEDVPVMNDDQGYFVRCPECGERHEVYSYGEVEFTCVKCKIEFKHLRWG